MNRTFYIPRDKEDVMLDFIALCDKNKTSYSQRLVEFMEQEIKENTNQ